MSLFALDIETTGTDRFTDRLLLIGVYNAESGYKSFKTIEDFSKWLDPSYRFILHNGAFDLNWLKTAGLDLSDRFSYDTKSMASILCPPPTQAENQKYVYGLENLYIMLLGGSSYKLDRGAMESYSEVEVEEYNKQDCVITWDLFNYLVSELDEKDLEFVEGWLMPATRLCAEIEYTGIVIDQKELKYFTEATLEKFTAVKEDLLQATTLPREAYRRRLEAELRQVYSDKLQAILPKRKDKEKTAATYEELLTKSLSKLPEFNFSSPAQMQWLLRDYYGLDIFNKRLEKETTNEAMLKEHADKVPVVAKLLEYREYDKLLSSSIPAIAENIKADGRVHARFNIGGTVTGRLSSSGPNLQQVPKNALRHSVVPREGYIFISSDLGQIEPRLIAEASQDPTLLEIFRNGWDLYSVLGLTLFGPKSGLGKEKVDNPYRNCAKTLALACFYGVGPNKFAEQVFKDLGIKLSTKQARSYIDAFLEQFPKIVEFKDKLEYQLLNGSRGAKARNLLGRPFTITEFEKLRNALNVYIQGSGSDLLIHAVFTHLIPALKEAEIPHEINILIHDQVLFSVPLWYESLAVEIARLSLTTWTEESLGLTVPLKTDTLVTSCWEK